MNAYSTLIGDSPCGALLAVVAEDGALVHLEFLRERPPAEVSSRLSRRIGLDLVEDEEKTAEVRRQLAEYFEGRRRDFDIELRPQGTEFQQAVWRLLSAIPFGGLTTYGEIARSLGRPSSSRAVGRAVGTNPIPVIIPCHRVIGKDRSLTGFGGGLPAKVALLELEGLRVAEGYVS